MFQRRTSNVRGVLSAVIDRGLTPRMEVSAASVVAAAIALSKLDSEGRSVDRFERTDGAQAFINDPRWTIKEMRQFAERGRLPDWADDKTLDTSIRASDYSTD